MHHIIFTSLPKTLTGGSGYGIAAATPDCPRLALEEATKLAGYAEIYPATHPSKDQNPINYFFVKQSGFHILGRLSVAPNDYSGRSNYLGQFFILGPDYLPDCGPAALLKALPFIDRFEGEARYLPTASLPNLPNAAPAICASWQRSTGDAGWAGVVADQLQSGSQVNILYGQPCRGLESLNLLADIFSLLPKSSKWQTTFSTHVEGFPKGTATKIRMLQEGDRKTQDFQKLPHLFDLTKKDWDLATDSPLVNQARTGIAQEPVLKIQPQAPAWPQKQFTTPLQPDLDIGIDQDWYTIQPEPLEPKGKNPQKIHVQPEPPPVLGKKTKLETTKSDQVSTFGIEKHESKGASRLFVLAFLFLGLLLGGGSGFGGGYWFRSGNEKALFADKTAADKKLKNTEEKYTNNKSKLESDLSQKEASLVANENTIKEKDEEIGSLRLSIKTMENNLQEKTNSLNQIAAELKREKNKPLPERKEADPEAQALKLKMKKIDDMPLLEAEFFNAIMESQIINNETKNLFKKQNDDFIKRTKDLTNLENIERIKDSLFVINLSKMASKPIAAAESSKKKSKEAPSKGGDGHLQSQINSITLKRIDTSKSSNNEKEALLKNFKLSDSDKEALLKNFKDISRETKSPSEGVKLFFFDEEKTPFGTYPTFNIPLFIQISENYSAIEDNFGIIRDSLKGDDLKDVESLVELCKIFSNQRKKAQDKLKNGGK